MVDLPAPRRARAGGGHPAACPAAAGPFPVERVGGVWGMDTPLTSRRGPVQPGAQQLMARVSRSFGERDEGGVGVEPVMHLCLHTMNKTPAQKRAVGSGSGVWVYERRPPCPQMSPKLMVGIIKVRIIKNTERRKEERPIRTISGGRLVPG